MQNMQNLPNQTYQPKPLNPNFPTRTFQTKPTKPNLPNQTYQTKPTKPNLPNQTDQFKHTKPNLPKQTYRTRPNQLSLSSILNQTYQTKYWSKQSTPGSVVPLAMFSCRAVFGGPIHCWIELDLPAGMVFPPLQELLEL